MPDDVLEDIKEAASGMCAKSGFLLNDIINVQWAKHWTAHLSHEPELDLDFEPIKRRRHSYKNKPIFVGFCFSICFLAYQKDPIKISPVTKVQSTE